MRWGFFIPYLLENKEQGSLVQLLNMISREENLTLDLQILPTLRTRHAFASAKANVLLPGNAAAIEHKFLKSLPFFNKKLVAFSTQKPAITQPDQLENKTVGYVRGYSHPPHLLNIKNASYEPVQSDRQGLMMLLHGRIDVLLCDVYTCLIALKTIPENTTPLFYDENQPLSNDPIFFAFQDNNEGTHLQNIFNRAIKKIRQVKRMPDGLY